MKTCRSPSLPGKASCWRAGIAVLAGLALAGDSAPVPPLPKKIEPRLVVRGISFAEGPTFDSKGNLFFVNYKGNGNIGRRTPDGAVEIWLRLPDAPPGPDGKVRHAFPFGLKA